ncbi:MAG: hypothetical protein HKO01_11350 [Flaviramulus sp.]|nr:hypothetical protein [Flaviramulus sp.]NNC51120.1 hypothetical protein [Flaviramulus sp.]
MKKPILILIICFLTLFNCSLGNETNNTPPQIVKIYWNLVNVSGGFEGVNDNFEVGTIIWEFNDSTETLSVDNQNNDDTKQDGLDSGNYSYSIFNVEDESYIIVDDIEVGSMTLTSNELVINENETSEGSAADGFIYTFSKTTITQ